MRSIAMGKISRGEQTRAASQKLGAMLTDLRQMKSELLPGAEDRARREMMDKFDDFEKLKYALNDKLKDLRGECDKFADLKRQKGEERDATMIKLQNSNTKAIKECEKMLLELQDILKKSNKKRGKQRIDEETFQNRVEIVSVLGKEIRTLSEKNSRVAQPKSDAQAGLEARRADRLARRQAKKEKRRARRGDKAGIELDEDLTPQPMSQQEQKFMDQVSANVEEQDEMLDEISKGLDELKELSLDMNKNLKLQSAMLEEVDEKMDTAIREFKTANERLKDLLDQSGGLSRWCPMFMCIILLLGCIGYIVNKV